MAGKTVQCTISKDLVANKPDLLTTDCLRVETMGKVVISPGNPTRINLAIHNSASEGRMGQVHANFDPRQVSVVIPNANVYVAANGKTVVFAILTAVTDDGTASITFDVF